MHSKIKLLPKNVINQIAAGEVIQRPASIVKELIDNSVDARAKNIHLIIKKSGKESIQVIDDGIGMNKKDILICFERHSTSKISTTEDIFHINTLGFRGEALSSIASVAKVILKSKEENGETGNQVILSQGTLEEQKQIIKNNGTDITVKNLFFNIPARKNFLKTDKVELRHIVDEFTRSALANKNISFKFTNNNDLIYNFKQENLKQRINSLFGKNIIEKIVPIEEETDIVSISGFLGKPSFAKKTRGEQFFFVNDRFVKAPYLHHAVTNAFDGLIQKDVYASYFIFLKINTEKIDLNVHPSKTEIKFDDDKLIYSILLSSSKRSIGKFNISPSIDFETESSFNIPTYSNKVVTEPKIHVNKKFNPFDTNSKEKNTESWKKLFDSKEKEIKEEELIDIVEIVQINEGYVICVLKNNQGISSTYLLDQRKCHQRIIYENQLKNLNSKKITTQKLIFSQEIELTNSDLLVIKDNELLFNEIGYNIKKIEKNLIVLDGIPSFMNSKNLKEKIEFFIEEIKNENLNITDKAFNKISRSVAKSSSIKQNDKLEKIEMVELIKSLFNCESPFLGIDGKPCMINFEPKNIFDV
ncbi:MAG: DNA mismatch repair protein MutL [Flavobacteriales bacterium]|nr:DNA mismatch repair protein MutL [Flavobacteriales bacterium]|tara:strand:- start:2644 stop:4404 length:1761 start_codon:yes stop_codon:yes gene_type:complete